MPKPPRPRAPSAILLAALSLGPAAMAGAQPPIAPIPITNALDRLADGNATRAVLLGSTADPELHVYARGRHYVADLTPDLTDDALAAARRGDVPLTVERQNIEINALPGDIGSDPPFSVSEWMQTWAPLLLLGALVIVSAMALRVAGGGRFKHRMKPVRSETRFDDVAGIDEIRDEVAEIVDVLRNPAPYKRLGATLPKGVILHGPPGTGKTLLAKAVAGEAGVPFFSVSGSEFVEVYAGLGSRRIRKLFAAARKAAPAVLYIDEIDAVGGRRTGHAANGEREQTLDQLLAEMDGFSTDAAKPVVVLASTNRLEDLDPALVRSGRFDRKIAVALPDRQARREIIDVHLRERPLSPNADPGRVAAMTAGLAGADLAALCNEAAFEAARAGRDDIDLDHFRRALMRLAAGPERRTRVMSEVERRLVAYHEIGHALVGHMSASCDPVERVTVIPQAHALGVTIFLPDEDRHVRTRTECMESLAMGLGGRAAEELVFGEFTTGARNDLEKASELARSMARDLAMAERTTEESLLVGLPNSTAPRTAEDVERAAQTLLREAFQMATAILEEHRDLLERGSMVLLDREALERDEIIQIFGPRPGLDRLAPLRG